MFVFTSKPACFILLLFLTNVSYGQKEFSKLSTSADSSFGYTDDNPLRLKKGNQMKSMNYAHKFLGGLRTADGQSLLFLSRSSVDDPAYKKNAIRITDRRTGLPISGKLGLLDKYVFLTSARKDTLTLFVDIYNKGELLLPVGLKFEQP